MDFVEGSIVGWAVKNREHVSALREAMNRRIEDEGLDDEDQFADNEELIVHMLDDCLGVYQDLAKHHYPGSGVVMSTDEMDGDWVQQETQTFKLRDRKTEGDGA